MKKLSYLFMLCILLPATLITMPSKKQQKNTAQSITNAPVKKPRFVVPPEILDSINKEKAAVFRATYNNAIKNNAHQEACEELATQLAKKAASKFYKKKYRETDESRKRSREYNRIATIKKNVQQKKSDTTTHIKAHINKLSSKANIQNVDHTKSLDALIASLFAEDNLNETCTETVAQPDANNNFIYCFAKDTKKEEIYPHLKDDIEKHINENQLYLEINEDISDVNIIDKSTDTNITTLLALIPELSHNEKAPETIIK